MTETQRRFLREMARRVGARVHEVRLFPAIRQGGIESGVAIVAARPLVLPPEPAVTEGDPSSDVAAALPVVREPDVAAAESAPSLDGRYEIFSARYKLTLKGPDRGAWEVDVRHEADAPLETIERVVRGVALRAGEDGEPELLNGARLVAALSDAPFVSDTVEVAEYGAG
jgi:hypothetical protein